jgi:hypothetical protein
MIKKLDIAQARIATSLSKGNSMSFKSSITAALLLAALGTLGTTAFAEGGQTRGQLKAVLSEPLRGGDRVNGEAGLTINELSGRTPVKPEVPGAREQVKAELAEASRNGEIVVGEAGLKLNELYPGNYPAKPTVVGKTREQVKIETAEAIRAGDIAYGEAGLKRNELFPQVYAKQRKHDGEDTALNTRGAMSDNVKR